MQVSPKRINNTTNGYFARVALSFARKIGTDLIAFARNVIALMTNNTQYPTPTPTLATLTTSVNAFETAVHEALNGGRIVIATRNAARVELLALMRQLAAYVQVSGRAPARTAPPEPANGPRRRRQWRFNEGGSQ